MRVLVTGANGFVGRHVCKALTRAGHEILPAVRQKQNDQDIIVGEIDGQTDWRPAFQKPVDAVIHCAAHVHVKLDEGEDAAAPYYRVNLDGTVNLARQSAAHGIKRFVFISTVKVLGEGKNEPYRDDDPPAPEDAYAKSKHLAEEALRETQKTGGMEISIIRPPLIYGPGVGANFLKLVQAVDKGIPLPFGCIDNRRSLVNIANLTDAILFVLTSPNAAHETFLVSDGDDVSTPELIRRIATALNRSHRLLPIPPILLKTAGMLLGKKAAMERLLGSLTVEASALRSLGWTPPYTMQQGLCELAKTFAPRSERDG